ncbi:MAG: hypothetical protein U0354_20965 [Candidatus Sericytochromatia bacterium]
MFKETLYKELWGDILLRRVSVVSIVEGDLKVGYGHEIPNISDMVSAPFARFLLNYEKEKNTI